MTFIAIIIALAAGYIAGAYLKVQPWELWKNDGGTP